MAEKGTYLDPQAGLVIENYLLNKEKYLGTPGTRRKVLQQCRKYFR
jgi:hypothetical protein